MASGYINIPAYGSASWKDPVASAVNLPTNGNQPGDTRVVLDTDMIYIWSGSAWVAAGGGGSGGITQLTGDVTTPAMSSGVVAATVVSVGGSTAAAVNTATVGYGNATTSNTPNTLVLRGNTGEFSAGFISATGYTSTPGTSGSSEIFGLGASSSGAGNAIFGSGSSSSGTFNTLMGNSIPNVSGGANLVIGYAAQIIGGGSQNAVFGNQAQGYDSGALCLGFNAVALGLQSTCVGAFTYVGGQEGVGIGGQALVTGTGGTAIGFFSYADANGTSMGFAATAQGNSIALGSNSITFSSGQCVVGGSGSPITDIYFGTGISDASPSPYTIRGVGANGTDLPGSIINIAGGQGTGTGLGGAVNIKASPTGSSGSTPNASATVASFTAAGTSFTGGITQTTRIVTTTYTVDSILPDYIIFANTAGGAFTLTLPAATNGRILIIKDYASTFTTNPLTLSPSVEGTSTLITNGQAVRLTSDGTSWFFI